MHALAVVHLLLLFFLMINNQKDWFKIKRYPHIGLPLYLTDRSRVARYVKNPHLVARHSFYPFIHRAIKSRKYRKCYDEDGNLINNGCREVSEKVREIFYANHFDGNIFSYYAHLLSKKYEHKLNQHKLNKVATAYRSIPLDGKNRGMNNIDFAEEVFEFIRTRKNYPLAVTTFDIKSFFDNLDHKQLKTAWANILGEDLLPKDHYNVYKNITRFSYIEYHDVFEQCKDCIWVTDNEKNLIQKSLRTIRELRRKNAIAFCTTSEFKNKLKYKNKIKSNKYILLENGEKKRRECGIPQGSPISSVLANIYLLDFDERINKELLRIGGFYRRYSDDIVIVCPYEHREEIEELVLQNITEYKLTIQKEKTNSFYFNCNEQGKLECKKIFNKSMSKNKRLEYLGFEFDGEHTYIKSASVSKFYRNMKRAISRGGYYAAHSKYVEGHGRIFRKRLYKRFSFIEAKRRIKWKRSKDVPPKWTKETKHNWGNFLTYAYMAQHNMKNNKIGKQVSHHWRILNTLIKDKESKID